VHTSNRPCIRDLTDYLREFNKIDWRFIKDLNKKSKGFRKCKNVEDVVNKLKELENEYKKTIKEKKDELQKQVLDDDKTYNKIVRKCMAQADFIMQQNANSVVNKISNFFNMDDEDKKIKDRIQQTNKITWQLIEKEVSKKVEEKFKYYDYPTVTIRATIATSLRQINEELAQNKNIKLKEMNVELQKWFTDAKNAYTNFKDEMNKKLKEVAEEYKQIMSIANREKRQRALLQAKINQGQVAKDSKQFEKVLKNLPQVKINDMIHGQTWVAGHGSAKTSQIIYDLGQLNKCRSTALYYRREPYLYPDPDGSMIDTRPLARCTYVSAPDIKHDDTNEVRKKKIDLFINQLDRQITKFENQLKNL
jgi:uncharacterized protein YsxB (DUF464 family)